MAGKAVGQQHVAARRQEHGQRRRAG